MRHTTTLLLGLFIGTTSQAQLINGSFEQDGTFSADGWTASCQAPGAGTGGSPGGGQWHATLAPGHFKGCSPNYLYQPIPGAQNGTRYLLSGWVRCDGEEPCMGGFLGIGRTNGAGIEVDDLAGGQFTDWTFIEIVDTVEVEDGEEAVVVLTAGSIGGPALLVPAYFDGLQLDLAMAVPTNAALNIEHYMDLEQRMLSVSAGQEAITGLLVYDLTGRRLPVSMERASGTTVKVIMNGAPAGAYFAQVSTRSGARTIRFTTW